jgi:hypothetical protein
VARRLRAGRGVRGSTTATDARLLFEWKGRAGGMASGLVMRFASGHFIAHHCYGRGDVERRAVLPEPGPYRSYPE